MAKQKSIFVCQSCGTTAPRWMGRCAGCGEWNTLVEETTGGDVDAPTPSARGISVAGQAVAQKIGEVRHDKLPRILSGTPELDRVLGGGIVPGSALILGGEPGIGKSTLLLQMVCDLAARGLQVLYVTGEESAAQVAMRAERLERKGAREVSLLATTQLEDVEGVLLKTPPSIVILDSVQTIRSAALSSAAGSVGQLREVTARLVELAKVKGFALFFVGHVTKEGSLAGPKVLEHLVDVVLTFEGDRTYAYRLVRSTKNRFGPAHEVAVFDMGPQGLSEVPDPSALFLAERPVGASGTIVMPSAEGTRPLLVELQALVAPAAYGAARRIATGLDAQRLSVLLAVLHRKAGVHVLDQDVFASVAGGLVIDEPATDLAMCLAIVSSLRDKAIAQEVAAFGEVGLAGEVRAVPRADQRLLELASMNFKRVILPKGNVTTGKLRVPKGMELVPVTNIDVALGSVF